MKKIIICHMIFRLEEIGIDKQRAEFFTEFCVNALCIAVQA